MGERYDNVQEFEQGLSNWTKGLFLAERVVFGDAMELILEPLDSIAPKWQDREEKSPVIMLISRMFNDFEAAKLMILYGLPEQCTMAMRDSVECMMLLRLFVNDSKLAMRWMIHLKEYQPSNVKKRLDELEIECPEHTYYGMLSELSHANFLGSVSQVQEIDLGEKKLLRKYHFGGYRNERWLALQFKTILILMMMALTTVLPPVYAADMKDIKSWWQRVERLPERMSELGVDIDIELTSAPREGDVYQRIAQKLRVHHVLFSSEEIDENTRGDSQT